VLQLNEEVNQKLGVIAPLIVFFGMPEKEQMAVLPVLEERKYDFLDGDWITSNALDVLVFAYDIRLNSIPLWLMTIQHMQDESGNKSIRDLVDLVDELRSIIYIITEEYLDVISNADIFRSVEWKSLRQFSSAVQRILEIQLVINTEIMKNCVEYWLHP
jgi:hypothetical protein